MPVTIPIKPTKTPMKITDLKFFPSLIAILAGKTIIVDTRRAPAAGIVKAIAIPVTILNNNDIKRTGKPSTKAVSSSNVRTYIGLMNNRVKIKTITAMTNKAMTCPMLIVTIEPNKYCSKFTLPAFSDLLVTIKATAKPSDIRIAVEISI